MGFNMAKSNPKLVAKKPKSAFDKSIQVDFKGLFKSISNGIIHATSGKWEEVANDAVETLSAIGIATEPEELAFLLIRRSLIKALFELLGESASQQIIRAKDDSDVLLDQLDFAISTGDVHIEGKFFDRPADLPLLKEIQVFLQKWLESLDVSNPSAKVIVDRLPSYFVYALNQEWRKNAKSYLPIIEALDTPFSKAGDREWAWTAYSALLQRRIHEGIFDEPFSLSQIYVPLNAFYLEKNSCEELNGENPRPGWMRRRVVVSLQKELERWMDNPSSLDAIRVISGGPGSGKSSFARVFAAKLSHDPKVKVLYVPLHLIDASKDLVEEIGRFVQDEGLLLKNPLDPDSPERNLLIIFDGLDELASQGKAAAETARAFVQEVDRTVMKRNMQSTRLRVLISGRELIVQENESEFRRPGQILTLLPYWVHRTTIHTRPLDQDGEEYSDPEKLLENDLRQQWWMNYGALTGRGYNGLPHELDRDDLTEVTAQPLLNYLVALSFTREKLDFTKDINLNSIYADLVAAVHERGYEKHRAYVPIRHMKLEEFSRVLEEIGLAAWHGDGRTTTVREIEEHCHASGVGRLLETFQEGARTGVTRLLAAFFFRQYGQRPSGDPTFVFTHKSFGEYLTARRIVRAMDKVIRELKHRAKDTDEGWDERDALKHWARICGPSAVSPYLHVFLINEIKLRSVHDLAQLQVEISQLFNYMLQHGMPMENLQIASFKKTLFQSRNAEEALLVALNACARVTMQVISIEHPDPTAFGAWFRRVQGQRTGPESVLAAHCLSFLHLDGTCLDIGDFYNADLRSASLRDIRANYTCFGQANLENADLRNAVLNNANFEGANLKGANLEESRLLEARLGGAHLEGANLRNANLNCASLKQASIRHLISEGKISNLRSKKLVREANLTGAILEGASLEGVDLEGVDLEGVNLGGAILESTKPKVCILPETEKGGK